MCTHCYTTCKDVKSITFFDNGQPKHVEFFRNDVIDVPDEDKPDLLETLNAEIDSRWAKIMEMANAKKLETAAN